MPSLLSWACRELRWPRSTRSFTSTAIPEEWPNALIAVGANIGDRVNNIRGALQAFQHHGIEIIRYSRLYESAAAYVEDQPNFLNAALAVRTPLGPKDLLKALKSLEASAGRDFQGQRFGPRPLDLDIVSYGQTQLLQTKDDVLELPHPRWAERDFVKAPLSDLYSSTEMEKLPSCAQTSFLAKVKAMWDQAGGETQLGNDSLRCVLPLGRGQRLWSWQGHTQVMGVLNLTPDSFSDGGHFNRSTEASLNHVRKLVAEGADIIDIGGQSTRPGAATISAQEELSRIIPVIRAMRKEGPLKDVIISVDTFYSDVAAEAVQAGADIINDISGGLHDPNMYHVVANLGAAFVIMHMRGTAKTMQSAENTRYHPSVVEQAGKELQSRVDAAIAAGIEAWRIITDPGADMAFSTSH